MQILQLLRRALLRATLTIVLLSGGLLLGSLLLGGCAAPPRHSLFSGDSTTQNAAASADSAASSQSPGAGAAMKPHSTDEGSGDASGQDVLAAARSYLGIPYRYGGESRDGVDCSGLVLRVYASCGVSLPRSCAAQYTRGVVVKRNELAPGDLMFFGEKGSLPSHVGIYEGNGHFIHASTGHRAVRRDSLDLRWFDEHYRGARRILPAP